MMRPTMVIRAQAFRKGLLGNNPFWRAIAMALIGKRIMDATETGADELLIVGDDHSQCHRQLAFSGSRARTPNPPSALRPASSTPP